MAGIEHGRAISEARRGLFAATFVDRFWARVDSPTERGCREWNGTRYRYGYGSLKREGNTVSAHRVAWEMAHGPIPTGLCVLHRCDNPPCVEATHLFLGTKLDNNRDRMFKGKGNIRLTVHIVQQARLMSKTGISCREIGERFGVHPETIRHMLRGNTWRHI